MANIRARLLLRGSTYSKVNQEDPKMTAKTRYECWPSKPGAEQETPSTERYDIIWKGKLGRSRPGPKRCHPGPPTETNLKERLTDAFMKSY